MARFRSFQGMVTHTSGGSVNGLDVEAWLVRGATAQYRSYLGRATTAPNGAFTLALPEDDPHVKRALGRGACVGKRIEILAYRKDTPCDMPLGQQWVTWNTKKQPYSVNVQVAEPQSQPGPGWTVMGILARPADGSAVADATIKVIEKKLGGDVTHGTGTTNASGRYTISFTAPGSEADLYVRAEDSGEERIASSKLFLCVKTFLRVDLRLSDKTARGPSQWAILDSEISALLPQGTTASDLDVEEALFLSQKLSEEPRRVTSYLAAKRLADEHTTTNVDAKTWFALLAQGLPPALSTLSGLPASQIKGALERSIDQALVPEATGADPDAVVAEIRAWRTARMLATNVTGSLGQFLEQSSLPQGKWQTFLNRWRAHTGTPAAFWADLAADPDPDLADNADDVRKKLFTARLVLGHAPMIEALVANYTGPYDSARDLAKLTQTDWETLIDSTVSSGTVSWPEGVQGANKKQTYAKLIRERVEAAFPTARIREDAADAGSSWVDVATFLTDNDTFDFERTRIDQGWSGFTTSGLSDPDEAKATLKAMQRLYRVLPEAGNFAGIAALLDDGVRSAFEIERMGQHAFVSTYGATLGESEARATYARARQQVGTALMVYSLHSPQLQSPIVKAVSSVAADVSEDAGLVSGISGYSDLFGSLGTCECTDCVSVLGPGAYLVDLMSFVQDFGGDTELGDRREDLGSLKLTCANTNTPLPYIDLVNELLEDRVAATWTPPLTRLDFSETTKTAAELRVTPEYRNDAVYTDVLATEIFPFVLPFDLGLEEARAFLEHLGVPRHRLLRVFPSSAGLAGDEALATERLGLSAAQWALVTGTDAASTANEFWLHWGYATETGVDDPRPDTTASVDWDNALRYVPEFLTRSDLEYKELLELLHARVSDVSTHLALSETCDVLEMELEKASTSTYATTAEWEAWFRTATSPLMRFLRLWRATGWRMLDLDRAIYAFGGTIDADSAENIGLLIELQDRTKRPVLELLSWFSDLDTRQGREVEDTREPSRYDRLFQDPSMEADEDSWDLSVLEALALNADRDELENATTYVLGSLEQGSTTAPYHYEQPAVTQAILSGLGIDYADLALLLEALSLTSANVNLANLSTLDRYVSLSRAVGLSIEDTLDLKTLLSGLHPDPFAGVAEAIDFMDEVARHKAGPFSVPQLLWLLGHDADATTAEGPDEDDLVEILSDLHAALSGIEDEDEDVEADERLVVATTTLAAALELSAEVMAVLLESTSPNLTVGSESSAGAELTTDSFLEVDEITERADAQTQYDTLVRLHKAARILLALDLDEDETSWLLGAATDWGLLDLSTLPVAAGTASSLYASWKGLRDLLAQRARLVNDEPTFVDLVSGVVAGNEATFLADLAEAADVAEDDLTHLDDTDGFDLTWPDDWQSAETWKRVLDALDVVTRLGTAASRISGWAAATAGLHETAEIRLAARSRHDERSWATAAAPVQDRLRERQRDALVGYLVQNEADVDEPLDLFRMLLIDVEMGPIQLSTRIRQALSSVQLFVHRCLLGQESGLSLSEEQVARWEWMKHYRVWEAALKVFLWPENWLDPSLRIAASPEYKTFSSEILSADLDTDTAEEAYQRLLEGMNELAHLEVVAFVHQEESDDDGEVDTLHVFARTYGDPHRFVWRRREYGVRWTPWESLELTPETDHLLPVVRDGRLLLFWPSFQEDQESAAESGQQSWIVYLNVAEWRQGRWSTPRRSEEALAANVAVYRAASDTTFVGLSDVSPADFTLRARESGERLYIDVFVHNLYGWDSTDLERVGSFSVSGCDGAITVSQLAEFFETSEALPANTVAQHQAFESETSASLYVPVTSQDAFSDQPALLDGIVTKPWRLVVRGDDPDVYADRAPLFLVDDGRAFVIRPLEYASSEPEQTESWFDMGQTNHWWGLDDDVFVIPDDDLDLTPPEVDVEWAYPYDISDTFIEVEPPIIRTPTGPIVCGYLEDVLGTVRLDFTSNIFRHASYQQRYRTAMVLGGGTTQLVNRTYTTLACSGTPTGTAMTELTSAPVFLFETFYHPFLCTFLGAVRRFGVAGLLAPDPEGASSDLVRQSSTNPDVFDNQYGPTAYVTTPYPEEDIDFAYGGSYATYNWELFLHAPLLVAKRLAENFRFHEARQWLHYVFDPTRTSGEDTPDAWWRLKPFVDMTESTITSLEVILAGNTDDADTAVDRLAWELQVQAWRNDPFDPHGIAAIRTRAYQLAVFMQYLDNLIAWGDYLFRQDTMESINEATNLYVLALELLGDKPVLVEEKDTGTAMTVAEALANEDSDLAALEEALGSATWEVSEDDGPSLGILSRIGTFCIPANPKILTYWETVDDRLYKIRNSMNIEGQVRTLPLWDPPIDPGALVRANAMGRSLSSALGSLTVSKPNYRFSYLIQRCYAFCATVRGLGAALLAAWEKRDAEALSLLRSAHEQRVLDSLKAVREAQIEEAEQNVRSLQKLQVMVEARRDWFQGLIDEGESSSLSLAEGLQATASGLLNAEVQQLSAVDTARKKNNAAGSWDQLAGIMNIIPNFTATLAIPPSVSMSFGGSNLGAAMSAIGMVSHRKSAEQGYFGQILGITASYERRSQDWEFQVANAERELDQIAVQLEAASARLEMAKKDLASLQRQIENAAEVDAFLSRKFTRQELYDWMATQLASLYFQSYQVAVGLAVKTQKAWQVEIGEDTEFISSGAHWDSLKKGLLAGERLQQELERMEAAFLDQDDREYELSKTFSLARIAPEALIALRETGTCNFSLPEILFDLDFPGHYKRRIKAVSVSLPHVSGPVSTVPAELTLTGAQVRTSTSTSPQYARDTTDSTDDRFTDNALIGETIALSVGSNDSGLFEQNLRDERYLPFERAGAISDWTLEFPSDYPPLDLRTITDVELHLRYTAKGSDALRTAANTYLATFVAEGVTSGSFPGATWTTGTTRILHLVRVSHDLADAWAEFLGASAAPPTLSIRVSADDLPPALASLGLRVHRVAAFLVTTGNTSNFEVDLDLTFDLDPEDDLTVTVTLAESSTFGEQPAGSATVTSERPLLTTLATAELNIASVADLEYLEEMFLLFELGTEEEETP